MTLLIGMLTLHQVITSLLSDWMEHHWPHFQTGMLSIEDVIKTGLKMRTQPVLQLGTYTLYILIPSCLEQQSWPLCCRTDCCRIWPFHETSIRPNADLLVPTFDFRERLKAWFSQVYQLPGLSLKEQSVALRAPFHFHTIQVLLQNFMNIYIYIL